MSDDDRIVALLQELVMWTRFSARTAVQTTLQTMLRDAKHRAAYELSDGQHTQQEISKAVGLSQPAISELWKKWRQAGILIEGGSRPQHIVPLSDLGITFETAARPKSRRGEDLSLH